MTGSIPAPGIVVVLTRLRRAPGPAAAMRAADPGIDHRAPLGDVRAPRTAAQAGIR